MIIENADALKSWLTGCLEHMCDADPAALAKYVMALVKKDKSEKELKDICLDQLDVFLQKETKPFVDMLFETLSNKSYLQGKPYVPAGSAPAPLPGAVPSSPQQPPPPQVPSVTLVQQSSMAPSVPPPVLLAVPAHKEGAGGLGAAGLAPAPLPRVAAEASSLPTSTVLGGSKPTATTATAATAAAIPVAAATVVSVRKDEVPPTEEDKEQARSSHRKSKSRSRSPVGGRSRNRSREDERRSGRRFSDDRRRRTTERRRHDAGNRHRGDTTRNRWAGDDRAARSAGTRDRSHSGRRSRSPSRSRSRSPRSRNRSRDGGQRSEVRSSGTHSSTTNSAPSEPRAPDTPHGDTDYRPGQPPPTASTTMSSDTGQSSTTFHAKASKRCRDYDERGYCMRGDYCPFDHGNDPLIVEDVSVLRFGLSGPPPPPPPNSALPPQPALPQEPYNPEAPGMERPLRVGPPPFWGPPPVFHAARAPHRELIGVPTVPPSQADLSQPPPPPPPGRTVLGPPMGPPPPGLVPTEEGGTLSAAPPPPLPQGPPPPMRGPPPPPPHHHHPHHPGGSQGGPRYGRGGMHGSGGRGRMDYGRGGINNRAANHYDRCELEVRKVPRALNTITQLNNHFSRFGNIVNLQVCYDGDPEAALIRFSNHAEANAAYRCTEAVLNNRFIKVFWHNKDRNAVPTANGSGSVLDTSGASVASGGNAGMANQPTNGATAAAGTTETLPTKNIKDRLGAPPVEKSAVFNPIAGNLSRTVFNPAALKKNNVINTGLPKRTKEEQKTEVIKKKVEVQSQRQKLLEKHLQQYKLLLEKLGKCKTEKEREEIKQTIATLQPVIEKLQVDFKKVTNELISSRAPKAGMTTSTVAGLKVDVPHGPVGRTQAEKELLDAEMDLYNKMHRGDDTTALRKRVQELRQQARALGLLGGQWKGSRGGPPGRRGALRGGRGGGAALRRSLNVIDHRPRKVFVQGMDEGDKENLQAHFAQFGEVEGVELLNSGLVITFKTRKDAELGVSQGSEFKNRPLQWAWFKEPSRTASTSDSASASNLTQDDLAADDESNLALEEDLLLVDDEEEEDSEARSWRR
ncbi:RNA-binding protein 26-like isoform X2 [Dermacentor variabilis]|uniref:RNA-binding protein 26-like isoform X2 n=1 Tax=Dermacentor variabilis TaxID=34621 RepID=UPI003F5C37BB